MNNIKPNILFDQESQVMSIKLGNVKSVDSEIQSNLVLDYDEDGNVVKINLYQVNFDNFQSDSKSLKSFLQKSNFAFSVK